MTKSLFLAILAILILVVAPLAAQDQSGSVAIAEQIVPASESITNNFVVCVERLVAVGTSNKDARRDCLKSTGKAAKLASDGFDDASGATNANRPIFMNNGYGGSYGRSYTPRRVTVYRAPTRRTSVRVAPQATKPAAASRQQVRSSTPSVRRVSSSPMRRVSTPSRRSSR